MKAFSKNQLQRYPVYLKFFKTLIEEGKKDVSSPYIAKALGYSEEQIRKDLQAVSSEPGVPKKGRDLYRLVETLEQFLGYRDSTTAVLIGAGHLGRALLNYPNFEEMGLSIVAAFDVDDKVIGEKIGGKDVFPLDRLPNLLPRLNAHIAIVCVPGSAAQEVADLAVESGARALWNFAPVHLSVPDDVVVENVNLASSLAVLSHRLNIELSKE